MTVTDVSSDARSAEPSSDRRASARRTSIAGDPLQPASLAADRERARIQAAVGRRGIARMLALAQPSISHLGSANAAHNGLRYRPVAWTLIAVVALAFFLPGRVDGPDAPQSVASPSPVLTGPSTAVPAPSTPGGTTGSPEFAPVAPPLSITPSLSPTTPFDAGPLPANATDPAGAKEGASPDATPLSVQESAWASRIPPTPLPTDAVADGAVPVANRLGIVDRVSFVRLSGAASELVLVENGDSAREALGPGLVAICPVLEDTWEAGPAQSFDDAPVWDTETCVAGVESDDTWTFDLSSFGDRTGGAGFALVPTVDAPADFQVAFEVAVS